MKSSMHWKTIVVWRSKECDTEAVGGSVNRNKSRGEWNNEIIRPGFLHRYYESTQCAWGLKGQ